MSLYASLFRWILQRINARLKGTYMYMYTCNYQCIALHIYTRMYLHVYMVKTKIRVLEKDKTKQHKPNPKAVIFQIRIATLGGI